MIVSLLGYFGIESRNATENTMTKQLTVTQEIESNGLSIVLFSNGRVMVQQDGKTSFLNQLGRGLCSNPSSRHYPACADMMSAHRRHKLAQPRGCHECAFGKVAGCWKCGSGAKFVGMVDVDGEQFAHYAGVSL